MFKNYLHITLVNLRAQPVFSFIKIFSLSIGLASALLVFMHVDYVQNSNKHIRNWENTYRLVTHMKVMQTNVPYRTRASAEPYAAQLRIDYSDQIKYLAKIRSGNGVFSRGDESADNDYTWAEPDAVFIFDLDFVSGDAATALTEPNRIILSETAAEKYFGNEDPLGQTLTLDNQADLQVAGVFRDTPQSSTLPLEILVSVTTGRQLFGEDFMFNNAWALFLGSQTYLTLSPSSTPQQLNDELPNFVERNLPEESKVFAERLGLGLSLQSVNDIYLNPLTNFGSVENSSSKSVLSGLIIFSLLILASSCINFTNLSLAQISQRRKEIGVRKTIGASRSHIIWQFLVESLVLTGLAFVIAIPIIAVTIPTYTNLTSTGFSLTEILQSSFFVLAVAVVLATGLIAGIVPAVSLSRLQAVAILSGANSKSRAGKLIKAMITAAQFSVSATLILLAIAVFLQTEHMRSQNLGFEKDNLIILDSRYSESDPNEFNYAALKAELERDPSIMSVGASSFRPPNQPGITTWRTATIGPDDGITVAFATVDATFTTVMDLEFLAGRGFTEDFPADFMPADNADFDLSRPYGVVITDLVADRFGFVSPTAAVGEIIMPGGLELQIIGVVRQFLLQGGSESDETAVGALMGNLGPQRFIELRINPELTVEALAHIDSVWAQHRPEIPIDRVFFSQDFDSLIDARTGGISKAALFASIVTIFIAACGLYALASYSSLRRTKEIGVRKVLGASATSIISLLAWDFIKPVLLACVVSWPIAYFFINDFYADFSSRVSFPIPAYPLVTMGIVILALLTVAIQCFRTAYLDPVHSLRYE